MDYDGFLERLAAKVSQLRIGDPLEEDTDIGAIINERQFRKVRGYVEDGLRQPGSRRRDQYRTMPACDRVKAVKTPIT